MLLVGQNGNFSFCVLSFRYPDSRNECPGTSLSSWLMASGFVGLGTYFLSIMTQVRSCVTEQMTPKKQTLKNVLVTHKFHCKVLFPCLRSPVPPYLWSNWSSLVFSGLLYLITPLHFLLYVLLSTLSHMVNHSFSCALMGMLQTFIFVLSLDYKVGLPWWLR